MDNPVLLFLFSCFGILIAGAWAQSYGGGGQGSYGGGNGGYGGSGGSGYSYQRGQGSGIYFKKPLPIDEKPTFFRTPYWLPNMYYGHYGYPWTEWFDGGPRYVIPIMNAYPHGGGSTQNYGKNVGSAAYGGGGGSAYQGGQAAGSYSGGAGGDGTTTVDPLNDGFSYYKGVPIYQTYYEKYLLQKAQATTAASK